MSRLLFLELLVRVALQGRPDPRHHAAMTAYSHAGRPARRHRPAFFLIAALPAVLALFAAPEARAEVAIDLEAKVSKILDGDTFTLSGQSRRIRIWGLDAPEWNHQGGSAATATLRGLISGKRLRCAIRDIDRYGRLVA
jgi:endonuclease YncB( thermonuclease family)